MVADVPVAPETRVSTVSRFFGSPNRRTMSTGPEAPDHVSVKGSPGWGLTSVLVNAAALARAMKAGARTTEAFIVTNVCV